MEGGVGIILLLILVVVIGFVIAMYLTGGAILGGSGKGRRRPKGETHPVEENTTRMRTGGE